MYMVRKGSVEHGHIMVLDVLKYLMWSVPYKQGMKQVYAKVYRMFRKHRYLAYSHENGYFNKEIPYSYDKTMNVHISE